jgi:hypothetical protein
MYTRERSLYRPEAVQRYLSAAQQGVLPRFVAPRVLFVLWLLLGLLLAAGAAAWFVEVPVYASGQAVVVPPSEPGAAGLPSFLVVAFLPAENLAKLRVGQTALVDFVGRGERLANPLTAVLPEVSSPAAARQRFGLDAGTAAAVARPSAVAVARLVRWPPATEPASYVGGVYPVEIEVGSRRLLSLFLARADVRGD